MGIFKKMTLMNKGLRYKLMLAFSLMSIIPLLACMYLVSIYIFPQIQDYINISVIVLASVVIALLGLLLAKGLVDPVIDMAIEAKIIANGEFDRKIPVSSDDEIGNLGNSINAMTQKIKTNLDELKNYGQRMREINVDIHKKVLALSSLLQIGDIISGGSIQIDPLLDLALEKSSNVFDTGYGALYLPKAEGEIFTLKTSYNINKEKLGELIIHKGGHGIVEKALENNTILVLDRSAKASKEFDNFRESYGVKNVLVVPIHSAKKDLGVLLIGTRLDDFRYKAEDIDLVKVFAKQITIAIESDLLNRRTEQLEIKDDLTGLYNKTFILSRLEEEIKRAIFYQRPCSFIIFNIDNFKKLRDEQGELAAEDILCRTAKLIKDNLTPIGKAARIGGDEFAMLLPEKNKKEATHIAEEVRKKIEAASLLKNEALKITVSGGVSENPIDGTTSDELFKKAMETLANAKSSGKNKVYA